MSSFIQSTYSSQPAIGIAGQLADEGPREIVGRSNGNAAGISPGLAVVRGTTDGLCRPVLSTDLPVTGTTQIIASGVTSTTAAQSISGASLNGSIGATTMWPPRNVILTLNNHANWLLSTIIVQGLGADFEPIEEAFLVPANGNVTLTGTVAFAAITAVLIPVEGGTSGTLTVGTGVQMGSLDAQILGASVYDAVKMPATVGANESYAQYDDVPILRDGRIYVLAEGAVTQGDPVYVRLSAAGSEVLGAFGNFVDGFDCARLRGARWASTTTGAGIAVLEINLPVS